MPSATGWRRAREALAREDVQQLWEDANRAAHEAMLRTIEGGGPQPGDGAHPRSAVPARRRGAASPDPERVSRRRPRGARATAAGALRECARRAGQKARAGI